MPSRPPHDSPQGNHGVVITVLEDTFSRPGLQGFKKGNTTENGEDFKKKVERIFRNELTLTPGSEKELNLLADKESLRKFHSMLISAAEKVKTLMEKNEK
jgi:hypothetical protein